MTIPTPESIRKLNGCIFSTLSEEEHAASSFYLDHGAKFEVEVMVVTDGIPLDLEDTASREEAQRVTGSRKTKISVALGPGAGDAWTACALR